MPPLLYALTLCNLLIGTGAFVVGGIVGPVAASLDVGVATAGQAMTVYALSTAVLAPLALLATGHWPRRRALCAGMGVFALGNALCAAAPDFATLLAGRALMGVGAVFTPIAAGIAVALVEPARRGRALSLVFLGISLSYVIGVPLGAWMGFAFGWRWPVALVAAASLVATLALMARLPPSIATPGASLRGMGALLAQPAVPWTLALTLLYFVAIFIVFAYIGPVLQALQPMSTAAMSATLALFGLSGVAGTLLGGWAQDRFGAQRALRVQLVVLGAMMAVLPFTRGQHALLVLALTAWGIAGFGMMSPQQSRLAALSPPQAPVLLSLNTSMLYFGTALGAAIGGAAAGATGFARLSWMGVPFVVAGLVTLRMSRRHRGTLPVAGPGAAGTMPPPA